MDLWGQPRVHSNKLKGEGWAPQLMVAVHRKLHVQPHSGASIIIKVVPRFIFS